MTTPQIFGTIILVLIFLIVFVAVPIIFWWVDCYGYPKIKFSAFKKFYAINQNRWELYDGHVMCKSDSKHGGTLVMDHFSFGVIDFYRYKLWCKRRDKMLENQVQAKSIERMVESVKRDIKSMELLSQQEINKAKTEITYIFDNINGGN